MEEETDERTNDQQAEEDWKAPAAATDDETGTTDDEKADQEAIDKVAALEGAAQDLEDWPDDEAKHNTFGGPDGDQSGTREQPRSSATPTSVTTRTAR